LLKMNELLGSLFHEIVSHRKPWNPPAGNNPRLKCYYGCRT
jgi:hypothetical protein